MAEDAKKPDKAQKPAGSRRVVAAPFTRTVVRVVPPALLKIRLQNEDGEVLKYKAYSISWRGTTVSPLMSFTDVDGVLTQEIPAGATVADLVVGEVEGQSKVVPGWKLVVRLTTFASPDVPAGAAPRLSNMGYLMVPVPKPTDDPNLQVWADGHVPQVEEGALTYLRSRSSDPYRGTSDIYYKLEKDHDKV